MRVENGAIEGDLVLADELRLGGMVTGRITVQAGGVLLLRGMACSDLVLEEGSSVEMRGLVVGNVRNDGGDLVVYGMVNGDVTTTGGRTRIDPGAAIHGVVGDNT